MRHYFFKPAGNSGRSFTMLARLALLSALALMSLCFLVRVADSHALEQPAVEQSTAKPQATAALNSKEQPAIARSTAEPTAADKAATEAAEKAADLPTTAAALQARMQVRLAKHFVPASSYAVFSAEGLEFAQALGTANIAGQQGATTETLFRAGSITKTLTAIAILQLIEQGRFDLNTKIADLLPTAPIVNAFDATDPVRVIHVLEHTAGFDDMHFKAMFRNEESPSPHLEVLQFDAATLKVRFRPGTMMAYSNNGYALLGAIIETVSGRGWEDYVSEQVLRPLGMHRSTLWISEALSRGAAQGYTDEAKNTTPTLPIRARAAGSLWTTASELAQLGRFLLTDGASHPGILLPASVQDMKKVHSTQGAKAGLSWGYGLGVLQSSRHELRWFGHDGGVNGFGANMAFNPERGLGYVELHNSDMVGPSMAKPVAGYIAMQPERLPSAIASMEPALPKPVLLPPVSADISTNAIAGWYRIANSRNEVLRAAEWLLGVLKVSSSADSLRIVPVLGTEAVLTPAGGDQLRDTQNRQLTAILVRDGGGQVVGLEYEGQYLERTTMFAALAPIALFTVALLALLSAPFGRRKALRNPWLRRLPLGLVLALILIIACAANLELMRLSEAYWATIGIWLGSWLLPLFSGLAVLVCAYSWRSETATLAKYRALAGALGGLGLSGFFAAYHWLGLALWAW